MYCDCQTFVINGVAGTCAAAHRSHEVSRTRNGAADPRPRLVHRQYHPDPTPERPPYGMGCKWKCSLQRCAKLLGGVPGCEGPRPVARAGASWELRGPRYASLHGVPRRRTRYVVSVEDQPADTRKRFSARHSHPHCVVGRTRNGRNGYKAQGISAALPSSKDLLRAALPRCLPQRRASERRSLSFERRSACLLVYRLRHLPAAACAMVGPRRR